MDTSWEEERNREPLLDQERMTDRRRRFYGGIKGKGKPATRVLDTGSFVWL